MNCYCFATNIISLLILLIIIYILNSKNKTVYESIKAYNPNIINSDSISSIIHPAFLPNILK